MKIPGNSRGKGRAKSSHEKSEEKWLKPLVIIAIDTGLRLSNLCDLKWSEVNMFSRMITIDAETMKNGDYIKAARSQGLEDDDRSVTHTSMWIH